MRGRLYLERHARKVYAPELNYEIAAAHALASKIETGDIEDGQSVRDLYRPNWEGLGSVVTVQAGLELLGRLGRIRIETVAASGSGGRPSKVLRLNPAA